MIVADHMKDVSIGQQLTLSNVLLVGSKELTCVGHPYLDEAKVLATIEEITSGDKLIIFKKRRRKNSKRTKGFRRSVVTLRINKIDFDYQVVASTSVKV